MNKQATTMKLVKDYIGLTPLADHESYRKARDWADNCPDLLDDLTLDIQEQIDQYSEKSLAEFAETFRDSFRGAMELIRLNGLFVGATFAIVGAHHATRDPSTTTPSPDASIVAAMICWLLAMTLLCLVCRRRHRPTANDAKSIFEAFEQNCESNFREYITLYRYKQEAMYRIALHREAKLVNASLWLTIAGLTMLVVAIIF